MNVNKIETNHQLLIKLKKIKKNKEMHQICFYIHKAFIQQRVFSFQRLILKVNLK